MSNVQDIDNAGTGGGFRYLTEKATPNMVNQELLHTCQAACARQIVADEMILLSEADLLLKIGYIEGWGTTSESTANVLTELHPRRGFIGGAVNPKAIEVLCPRAPWIASLKTDRGMIHAVIVDCLEEEVIQFRDP